MSDLLIKGMKMPKEGSWVTLRVFPDGKCFLYNWCGNDFDFMEHLTAVPVPPHEGALVDRAALWVEINKICDRHDAGLITDLTCLQQILSTLRHAPTIIPANPAREEKN